jgi:hypothetical protein
VEEQRGRWWNRLHGRVARKDLWLWQDGHLWIVGARLGESDARIWCHQFDREAKARALIDQILARNGGRAAWLDLTKLTAKARVSRRSPMSDEPGDNG